MDKQSRLTDEEIRDMVSKSETPAKKTIGEISSGVKRRDLLIVGCGDGGTAIASHIRKNVPGTVAIGYNTSARTMDGLTLDIKTCPQEEDGAGKDRRYSKDVFKRESHEYLLGNVLEAIEKHPELSYIIIVTTADGGTGSGITPMLAKLIDDNVDLPVMVLGVYPAMAEDATAQVNTLDWQTELEKVNIPYMIFDNGSENGSKGEVHNKINDQIVNCLKVITGDIFYVGNISTIDSRDMLTLLNRIGGRIVLGTTTARPVSGQTLDAFIDTEIIKKNNQPEPAAANGIGVFLKGPKSVLDKMDTSLTEIRSKYGDATVSYQHIQEADQIQVGIIFSGCSEPTDRLRSIRSRYDDIMAAQRAQASQLGEITDGVVNPLAARNGKKKGDRSKLDMSALDL